MTEAARLTGSDDRGWRSVTTVWLAADEPPLTEPILVLGGSGTGPLNSLAVMSEVSPHYAPPGRSLIAASSPRVQADLVDDIKAQLQRWYGPVAAGWEVIRVDEIQRAQPCQPVGHERAGALATAEGIVVSGDHVRDASINGALGSGRAATRAAISARSG